MYTRNVWIIMWGTIYLASFKADCFHLLSNKGTNIIENQYYRFFTGLLVHVNCFHLIINAAALYWVLYFLDGKINEIKLMIFSLVTGSLTNMIFSMLYPNSQSIGGSPVVFSLIALMAVLQVVRKDLPGFNLNTAYGQWIAGYAILSNIPVFSKNSSTLVIHSIAFSVAFYIRDYRNENKSYLAAQRLGLRTRRGAFIGHQNSIGSVGIPDKISTNIPAPWKGRYMGSRYRTDPILIWRGCCMSSRPLPIPVRLKIPVSLRGETDLYEVLQKILLNYNPQGVPAH